MSVYQGHSGLPDAARGAVLALGNFDGVHKGHASVLAQAKQLAETLGKRAGVAVFTPHPRRFFQPDAEPFGLMSDGQRVRALQAEGAELVHHIRFDAALSQMSPEAFVQDVLHTGLGAQGIVTGADFCFGKGRAGTAHDLAALCAERDITARVAEAVAETGGAGKISSSDVRAALRDGDPQRAAALLGRPFAIEGEVSKGDQRGRTIGFPTANVALGPYLRPKLGVYATRSHLADGRIIAGVANLGERPTVSGTDTRLEVHLFDFSEDLYGQTLETELMAFIRPEQKFDGLPALTAQIALDSDAARRILR